MRSIRMTLLALVFGLSACSYSFTSGPNPSANYPQMLAVTHGPGKPAQRVARDAAPPVAKADAPKPAAPKATPEPPARPKRVGRADPAKPKLLLYAKRADEQPKLLLHARPAEPKPLLLHAKRAGPKLLHAKRAGPKLLLNAQPAEPQSQ